MGKESLSVNKICHFAHLKFYSSLVLIIKLIQIKDKCVLISYNLYSTQSFDKHVYNKMNWLSKTTIGRSKKFLCKFHRILVKTLPFVRPSLDARATFESCPKMHVMTRDAYAHSQIFFVAE